MPRKYRDEDIAAMIGKPGMHLEDLGLTDDDLEEAKRQIEVKRQQASIQVDEMMAGFEKAEDLEAKTERLKEQGALFRKTAAPVSKGDNIIVRFFKALWNIVSWPFKALASLFSKKEKGSAVQAESAESNIADTGLPIHTTSSYSRVHEVKQEAKAGAGVDNKKPTLQGLVAKTEAAARQAENFANATSNMSNGQEAKSSTRGFFGFGRKKQAKGDAATPSPSPDNDFKK